MADFKERGECVVAGKRTVVEEGYELDSMIRKQAKQEQLLIKSQADIPSAFDTLLKVPAFNTVVQAIKQAIDEGTWIKFRYNERYHLQTEAKVEEFWLTALSDAFFAKGWILSFENESVIIYPRNF